MSFRLLFARLLLMAWPLVGSPAGGWAQTQGMDSGAAPDRVFDNVVIVLDASGSMSGTMPGGRVVKMDAAKAALKQVLQQLPVTTQVGLLVFSGSNIESEWVYPLGPRDEARLTRAIDRPRPNGGTPLGAYIKKGADRLLEERARQFGYGTFRLLIVTDGEAQDQELVQSFTPEVMARGITVDVIGVAMSTRHTLATRAHSYRAANDASSLRRAIAEVFAEVGGVAQDTAGGDAFELLAPLPDAVAMAAIQALAVSGNHPIGERPAVKAGGGEPLIPAAESTPAPAPSPSASSPGSGGGSPPGGSADKPWPKSWILALFVALVVLKALKRKGR